jgi:sterol desaturase/sphingolipid hydroxylase (fatty acid hydroxylase superfamily)
MGCERELGFAGNNQRWCQRQERPARVLQRCLLALFRHPLIPLLPRQASFFIVRLLLMELVFDFFHYCSHRLSHTIPALYTRFHKIHHSHHADLHVGSTLQVIRPQVPLRR